MLTHHKINKISELQNEKREVLNLETNLNEKIPEGYSQQIRDKQIHLKKNPRNKFKVQRNQSSEYINSTKNNSINIAG